MKKHLLALLLGASCLSSPVALSKDWQLTEIKGEPEPSWHKDSKRLAKILEGDHVGEVSDTKPIGRYTTPIPGLFAIAIEGTVKKSDAAPYQDYFVLFTDKDNQYVVAGLLIDSKNNKDMGKLIEQEIRGKIAPSPARALLPGAMHGVVWNPKGDKDDVVTMVIDVGPDEGKRRLLQMAAIHQMLSKTKKVKPVRVIPVANGQDEMAIAAMALTLGFESAKPGDGYNKLLEYADKGSESSWMKSKAPFQETSFKRMFGVGTFKMEDNITHAVLAKVTHLPLVYVQKNGRYMHVPTPTDKNSWEKLLLKQPQ